MTVIVILALVALFIGLRLYSVLGERTGHEQQPILKPADPEAVVEPRAGQPSFAPPPATDPADLAFCRRRARACAPCSPPIPASMSPVSSKARKAAYRMILEAYWKGDLDTVRLACRRPCL